MPRYAVFETQKIKVVYYVDADTPEQAHDLVATMDWDDYDDVYEVIDTDIDMADIQIKIENGWQLVEE